MGYAPSVSSKLRPRAEQVGVVGHIEHSHIIHRPRFDGFAQRAIYKDRQPAVDCRRQVGIAARAENRRSAGIRIDPGEISGRQREAAFGISEFGYAMKKKCETCFPCHGRKTGYQDAKLKLCVDIREKQRPVVLFVLKIEKCF